ncbi:MAG: cytochrome c oxidase subunit 3 [Sediminibacterium sp.]|nr:cytochrome c oxidase subunit 3 [Sediminibacterium sp.]
MLKKINSKEFLLYAGICSIIMMFGGFTSAYLVKKNQLNWLVFPLPTIFYFSTLIILASSVVLYYAQLTASLTLKKSLIILTFILGIIFIVLQIIGFNDIELLGVDLLGQRSNTAASFIVVINITHIAHVIAGLIVLVFAWVSCNKRLDEAHLHNRLKLVSIFWHFLTLLWLYLFIFYKFIA